LHYASKYKADDFTKHPHDRQEHNNGHFSELVPHHGDKKSWHGYGMKKIRHCYTMHVQLNNGMTVK